METEYASWAAEDRDLTISYSKAAMESMRQAAMVGLQKIPRRGLEIGGVLFGRRDGDQTVVEEWREIACSHARGPGFDLSQTDEALLNLMLASIATDPHLSELDIVGWFRTRTKDSVVLSESDVRFFEQHFPEPWQVVLVIRPHMHDPAQAGFFFRDAAGKLAAGGSRQEFQLENRRSKLPVGFDPRQPLKKQRPQPAPPWERTAGTPPVSAPPRVVPAPSQAAAKPREVPIPMPADGKPQDGSSTRTAAIVAVAVAVFFALVILGLPAVRSGVDMAPSLRVRDVAGQLVIEWNRLAPPVLLAQSATLTIVDNAEERIVVLTAEELRGGCLVYQRRSGDVEISFLISGGDGQTVSEMTRFLGDGPSQVSGAMIDGGTEVLQEQVKSLREELDAEIDRSAALRAGIDVQTQELGLGGE